MNQLSENPEKKNRQREKLFNDNSLIRSRTVRRSDLTVTSSSRFLEETYGSLAVETVNRSKCTPSSSQSLSKPIGDGFNMPEYDISKKVEDFVFNSTPRQHMNLRSSATTSAR